MNSRPRTTWRTSLTTIGLSRSLVSSSQAQEAPRPAHCTRPSVISMNRSSRPALWALNSSTGKPAAIEAADERHLLGVAAVELELHASAGLVHVDDAGLLQQEPLDRARGRRRAAPRGCRRWRTLSRMSCTVPVARIRPFSITATVSHISASSVRMCELSRMVLPSAASSRISVRNSIRARGSRLAAGSSRMSTSRIVDDRAAERDALLEALRQALDVAIAQIADAHELDDVARRPCAAPRRAGRSARAKKSRYSVDGRVGVDAGVVGHEAGDPPHLLRIVDDGVAADARVAALRRIQRRQDAHRRRLAGAVGADEAEHLAALDAERDVVNGVDAVEVADQSVELRASRSLMAAPPAIRARRGSCRAR